MLNATRKTNPSKRNGHTSSLPLFQGQELTFIMVSSKTVKWFLTALFSTEIKQNNIMRLINLNMI
jgi:hypothetical protein